MKRWKIGFVITGIYLSLNGVGVQAQIDSPIFIEKFERELESYLENKMKSFDSEAEARRVQKGDEFDEDEFNEDRLVEDRRIRRMVLERTRSQIESDFSKQRKDLESSPPSSHVSVSAEQGRLDDAHAWKEFEESEKKFYEWLEEQYEALELVSPSADFLKLQGSSMERGIKHKTADRVGEGYPGANPLVAEDGQPLYASDDQEQSDTVLREYDLTGQEVVGGNLLREQYWLNDRLTWPVSGHQESLSLDQSFQTWEGKEILNTSFMDPSWTGFSDHTYPEHTGTDIGYFSRGKNAERWTKDTYEEDKSDFAFVIAAKGGEVVLFNNQEGDACGSWLLTQEQKDGFESPVNVNLEDIADDDCDGGCVAGNCAGNYVVIDHDPEEEGLLNRAGFRYTSYFHLQKGSDVYEGKRVERSEIIGKIGSSGQSMSPHLHFEVHKKKMNPEDYVKSEYLESLVDPFYSMHSSNNPTSPVGSSKWQNQCYRDTETMYGLVTGSYFPAPWSGSNLDLDAALEMSGENWRMCGMVPESGH